VTLLLSLSIACPTPTDDSATPIDDSASTGDTCPVTGGEPIPWTEPVGESDALYAVVGDFTVETKGGDWSFQDNWTGCDSYLFLQDEPAQNRGWPTPAWERDHDDFLERLPANTHVFFASVASKSDERTANMALIEEEMTAAIGRLDEDDQAWWTERIHYVTERGYSIEGPVGDTLVSPAWGTGIDRFQRLRYVGSYADLYRYDSSYGWFEPNLSMAANEPRYYNFEAERAEWMAAEDATVVEVFTGETVDNSHTVTAELPDVATLAGFDTLTLDCTMACVGDGEYGDCPAWDYMAYVYRCSEPAEDNPWSDTACEAEETKPGQCVDPGGTVRDVEHTCNADGTGFDDLDCGCGTEIGRWITTYHREGRWVYDISPMIPLLADGGTQTFTYQTDGPYEVDLSLRFSDQGKETRPEQTVYLFSGGTINSTYNDAREPVEVEIPADASKVELATVISQHGADGNNCGEFCDLCHHFTIDGDEADEIVRCFPEATAPTDCMDRVSEGTVPNQYGTWWYGRAGWCPGKEVPTVTHDITDQVTPGQTASITYKGLDPRGDPYDGSATILMRSWLVISR